MAKKKAIKDFGKVEIIRAVQLALLLSSAVIEKTAGSRLKGIHIPLNPVQCALQRLFV